MGYPGKEALFQLFCYFVQAQAKSTFLVSCLGVYLLFGSIEANDVILFQKCHVILAEAVNDLRISLAKTLHKKYDLSVF